MNTSTRRKATDFGQSLPCHVQSLIKRSKLKTSSLQTLKMMPNMKVRLWKHRFIGQMFARISRALCEAALTSRCCQDTSQNRALFMAKEEMPWLRIHVDFARPVDGEVFLNIKDAYLKWPDVIETSSTTSKATTGQLSKLFASFRLPETSFSGNLVFPLKFTEFCKKNGIVRIRYSPHHPQTNGQVERFVDTFIGLEKIKSYEEMTKQLCTNSQ
ncbi:hypothetical protein TELCIR_05427 [Teladorsagia circumcincta]|uniref:Integrase catalytic domain-containing protein n=1 Tax=Teladorsagia circumcincta TaxID=45464 RepID=A0A2G9UQU3_TELCI|nr:hypothetical protein TELCIR_05427 [Teladorsagia circumcincta]